MKFECAHCGEKVFNPIDKLLAGTIKSKGKVCKKCGGYNVNGLYCSVVTTILQGLALIYIVILYFNHEKWGIDPMNMWISDIIAFVGAFLLSRINMMFFGKLIKSMRNDLK